MEKGAWGYASDSMYRDRWALLEGHFTGEPFVLVDWGSDAGWFSIQVAKSRPLSTVISVEAGIMTGGINLAEHRRRMEEFGITNNLIVDCLFGPVTFEKLWTVPSDFQLVLSVFHHMGDGYGRYLRTVADWDKAFCDLVRGSNVTFFEVPNEDSPTETPHRVRLWYNGRSIETVIRDALETHEVGARIELLGETLHGRKGTRKMIKITLDEPVAASPALDIAEHIRGAAGGIKARRLQRLRIVLANLRRRLTSHEKGA